MPLDKIFGKQIEKIEGIKEFLKPLIEQQRITVRCEEVDTNPFIKRMADLPPDREVARLNEWKGGILTAYPTQKEMATEFGEKILLVGLLLWKWRSARLGLILELSI